jgi:hypothetical protein
MSDEQRDQALLIMFKNDILSAITRLKKRANLLDDQITWLRNEIVLLEGIVAIQIEERS